METVPQTDTTPVRETIRCPETLFLSPSRIPGVGDGVWTRMPVPVGTLIVGPCNRHDQLENITITESEESTKWMTFIKRARCNEEQNVTAFYRHGHVYYQTTKNVPAQDELLVWYDESLAAILGIDLTRDITKDDCGIYTCLKCFHPFIYRNSLLWHKLQFSDCGSNPELAVCCDGCGKKFQEGRLLKIHIMEHYTEMQLRVLMRNTGFDIEGSKISPTTSCSTTTATRSSHLSDCATSSGSTDHQTPGSPRSIQQPPTTQNGRTDLQDLTVGPGDFSVNRSSGSPSNNNLVTAHILPLTSSSEDSQASLNNDDPLSHVMKDGHDKSYSYVISYGENQTGNATKLTTVPDQSVMSYTNTEPRVSLPSVEDLSSREQGQEEKQCFCIICGRNFASSWTLREHSRVHTGERPYECNVCQKRFAHHSNMVRHYRIHTGERPYRCPYCDRKFAVHSNLTAHYPTHLGIKQFSCGTCKKSFVHASSLHKHLKSYKHSGVVRNMCADLRTATKQLAEAQKLDTVRNQMTHLLKSTEFLQSVTQLDKF